MKKKRPNYLSGDIFDRFNRLISGNKPGQPIIIISPIDGGITMTAIGDGIIVSQTFQVEHELDQPITLPYPVFNRLCEQGHFVSNRLSVINGKISANNSFITGLIGSPKIDLPIPSELIECPTDAIDGIITASSFVFSENHYAMGCIQLQGNHIAATSGYELYREELPITFPWSGELLCQPSGIFKTTIFRRNTDPLRIGGTSDVIYFNKGAIQIWITPCEGQFPHIDNVLKKDKKIPYTPLTISDSDAFNLLRRLDRLPGVPKEPTITFVSHNGQAAILGYDGENAEGYILSPESAIETPPHPIIIKRSFFKKALQAGIRIFDLPDTNLDKIFGASFDGKRQYTAMLTNNAPSIPPDTPVTFDNLFDL